MANEGRSQGPRRGGDDNRGQSGGGSRGGRPGQSGGGSRGGRPGQSGGRPAEGRSGGRGGSSAAGGRGSSGGYRKDDRQGAGSYGKDDRKPGYGKDDRKPSTGGYGKDDRKPGYGKDDRKPSTGGYGKDDRKGGFRKDDRGGDRRGGKPGGDRAWSRPRRDGDSRDDVPRNRDQAKYDGPPLDEEITGRELDRSIAQQLRGLPEKLAARVARHLVAAGQLIDDDPKTAYEHTLAARARASRIAIVREACGEAAYAAGEYAEALSELRAAKRMNGSQEFLPVMADCERALGRPEKALALAKNPAVANLSQDQQAEMTIVEAGARRDLGEIDAALRTLENAPLRSRSRSEWVVRLRYAYADTLLAAGRRDDALVWFHRTVGIDGDDVTDAAERVAELERDDAAPPS